MKKALLVLVALAGIGALTVKELPALRRELKIMGM